MVKSGYFRRRQRHRTGGGRSFCREGADVAIIYKESDDDANETKRLVEKEGQKCLLIKGDLTRKAFRTKCADKIKTEWKNIDILVNNAEFIPQKSSLEKISDEQIQETFDTNIISMISFTRNFLPMIPKGGRIICTTSVTANRGSDHLIDYAATKVLFCPLSGLWPIILQKKKFW